MPLFGDKEEGKAGEVMDDLHDIMQRAHESTGSMEELVKAIGDEAREVGRQRKWSKALIAGVIMFLTELARQVAND